MSPNIPGAAKPLYLVPTFPPTIGEEMVDGLMNPVGVLSPEERVLGFVLVILT